MKYLCISRCDDTPHLELLTEEQLLENLNDEWADYKTVTEDQIIKRGLSFLEYFPARSVLILKGDLCHKKAVETVTKWEIS